MTLVTHVLSIPLVPRDARASNKLRAGLTSLATSAVAADDMEQCAGVIKAGKNDCATSTNACHGHVEADSSPEAWIYVPKGTCERLVNGSLTAK